MPALRTLRIALVFALVPLLPACGGGGPDETPQATPAMAVAVAPAQVREIERAVVVSGPVAAWEEMQLGVELSGLRVTRLDVDVGERVKRGDVLLELDARSLESELAQARAAHAEAAAGAQLAQANLQRAESLAREQLISASAVDELRAARTQSQARQATARAVLDTAQLRRDFARLRAPDDGIISRRLVQPGQVVAAGTELLRLIRDGRLEWRAELADAELARVSVGDAVTLVAPDGPVEGRVRAVSPGVSAETRTGTVYADLPAPGSLRVGAYVEGRIRTGAARALTVPVAAVVQRDGNSYVFTVDADGTARRTRVRTGPALQGFVEILDGLQPGAQVIHQGAGFVADGDPVRVVAPTDAATPASPTTPAQAAP